MDSGGFFAYMMFALLCFGGVLVHLAGIAAIAWYFTKRITDELHANKGAQ